MDYDAESIREADVATITELPLPQPGRTVWIEFNGLADVEALRALGERYNLHPLALEDALHTSQRPKLDLYENTAFIVAYMIYRDDADRLCAEQVSMFLAPGLLITIQEDSTRDVFGPVRERLRTGQGYGRKNGADYLCYALLDAVVDHSFPILECLGEALEALEDEMLDHPDNRTVGRVHELRRTLLQLRRALWPERDLINALCHDESGLIRKDTKVFLRDCHDHAIRALDLLETYRELAAGLLELYVSAVSLRTNDIMRVLTVLSAIFIPLTFIVGLYGMNFEWMPELKKPWGYPAVLLLMLTIAIGQLWYFKKKRWL